MSTEETTLGALRMISEALDLIQDASTIARHGLRAGPTTDQRREIDTALIGLTQMHGRLTDALHALSRHQASASPTPPGHMVEIEALGA